jgi:hypothetical protein
MTSFPRAFPPTPCAHLYPPPYASRALPISFVSILPPAQYWVRSTDPGLFCLQRKHLNLWVILNMCFLRRGVVSTSPNPQAGGPPLVGCPRLLIQFLCSYPPYRRPFLHPQPEDAPCRGDRDPQLLLLYFFIDCLKYRP